MKKESTVPPARNKIILYLDKLRRIFLVYNKPDNKDKEILPDHIDVISNGVDVYKDSFKEKWILKELKETKSTSNELIVTMKFKLNLRKLE